jgi:hypothetical protein
MSYFAMYRGWQKYGAEGRAAQDAPDALRWDFPPQANLSGAVERSVPATVVETHRFVAVPRRWLAPLLRRVGRQTAGQQG